MAGHYVRTPEFREKLRQFHLARAADVSAKSKAAWKRGAFDNRDFTGEKNPNYGHKYSEELRETISKRTKECMTDDIKKKLSIAAKKKTGKKNHFHGRKHSAESKRKMSEAKKGKPSWNKGITGEEYFAHFGGRDRFIKNIMKGLSKRPTSFEQKIIDLCAKYELPYRYVGDGQVIIGYKNPDFINVNGAKLLIEVYFSKWHIDDYERKRAAIFRKYGYETIFLSEDDVLDDEWESICLEKINAGDVSSS